MAPCGRCGGSVSTEEGGTLCLGRGAKVRQEKAAVRQTEPDAVRLPGKE